MGVRGVGVRLVWLKIWLVRTSDEGTPDGAVAGAMAELE